MNFNNKPIFTYYIDKPKGYRWANKGSDFQFPVGFLTGFDSEKLSGIIGNHNNVTSGYAETAISFFVFFLFFKKLL